MKKFFGLFFSLCLLISTVQAQTGEVTVSLNEQFFDSLLDAVFKNLKQPSFPLNGKNELRLRERNTNQKPEIFGFAENSSARVSKSKLQTSPLCDQKILLHRQINDVATAVRFRDGRIYAPIAFSGAYNPPLIGCVNFQGIAETNIELKFDPERQILLGTVKVANVQLGGVANVASGLLARFVQNSIDKNINPIEILRADKLSFVIPMQNSGEALKLKATNITHEIGDRVLNVRVNFEFMKN